MIVGEFNAGKSAFINALVGSRVVEEGVTPTTAQINVLQYGDTTDRQVREPALHVITAPVPLLRDIHIVDTPGTNAIMREHERITAEFVPRSDLVLFVTSADRPFTETERAFLEQIRGWGKKVVVVINKIDILESDGQVDEVTTFVARSAHALLGLRSRHLPGEREARTPGQGRATLRSGRRAVSKRWSGTSRTRSMRRDAYSSNCSTRSACGVARRDGTPAVVQERLGAAPGGFRHARRRRAAAGDLSEGPAHGISSCGWPTSTASCCRWSSRGHDYFDDTMRIGRVMDLLNRSRVQQGFEQQVVADAPQQIEQKIGELVDWLVDMDLRQWQGVTEHLAERRRQYRDRIVGDDAGRFHYDRARLIDSVGGDAQRVVDSYDRRREAQELADGARNAVAAAAAVSAGAVGFGALVVAIATTAAADATGLIMASLVGTLGFFIIPAKRRRAKEEMRRKIGALRDRLSSSLREQFGTEILKSGDRIRESIAPYSRFVRAEGENLQAVQSELGEATAALAALRSRIEKATESPSTASSTDRPTAR